MNGTRLPCLTSVLSPRPWQTSSPPGQPFGTLVILSWYPSLVRPQFAIQFSRNTQPALTPPPAPLPAPISPNTPSIPLGFHTPNLPPLYKCRVWNGVEKWIRKRGESRHIDLSERLTQTPGCLLTSALPSLRRKSRGLTTSETDPKGCASDRLRIS